MRRLLLAAAAACLVTGCGSTSTRPHAAASRCSATAETMNCVLSRLPAPPKRYSATPGQPTGADFGWQNITPAQAEAWRLAFVASYLSNDPSKNFTPATVNAFHAAGIKTVDVWESTANRATAGRQAGIEDATRAKQQAAALGNTTRPILFAVDCDCAAASILPYFQGVDSVLPGRVDAYGGYSQVLFLHGEGVVGSENFQTYGWSGGKWLPASIAPLEQYLNGSTYDWDRAISTPYGQFPWSAPKPPAPPVVTHTTTSTTPTPVTPHRVVKPKPTTRLAIVVGPSARKPKYRAGYIRKGLGHGWWEYRPSRIAAKGARLVGRAARKPKVLKGYRRVVGLGDGWWQDTR